MSDLFSDVKRLVTVPEATQYYNLEPNRAGFISCPFHAENTASCRVWPDHFHCFSCGAHGSVIDLVGRLFNLAPLDAVKRLNDDFHLALTIDTPTRESTEARQKRAQERGAERARKAEREAIERKLIQYHRSGHLASFRDPETLTMEEATALIWLPFLQELLDED